MEWGLFVRLVFCSGFAPYLLQANFWPVGSLLLTCLKQMTGFMRAELAPGFSCFLGVFYDKKLSVSWVWNIFFRKSVLSDFYTEISDSGDIENTFCQNDKSVLCWCFHIEVWNNSTMCRVFLHGQLWRKNRLPGVDCSFFSWTIRSYAIVITQNQKNGIIFVPPKKWKRG